MKHMKNRFFTITKYLIAILLTVWAFCSIEKPQYIWRAFIELGLIFGITNLMIYKPAGRIINAILLLLYNVQMAVLAFSNGYITLVMLTNLESVEMLAGKAFVYFVAALFIVIASFLPVTGVDISKKIQTGVLAGTFLIYAFIIGVTGATYSPMLGYVQLATQQYDAMQLSREIENAVENLENGGYTSEYYQDEVRDCYAKSITLPEKPNIILIFTEGLSQNIISDERNIMPNVKEYQAKSINFRNYYNHTFATYRGLIGQLYSGYQHNNHDYNPLVSLQAILRQEGYHTAFLNSEPRNKEFTRYLSNFYFDEVIGDSEWTHSGLGDTMSDKDMYTLLYEEAQKQSSSDKPFFLTVYTVGTHVSFDSLEVKYEDGSNAELNKFFEADYYFGEFMKQFEESALAEDTIIIFTTDHATFADDSFRTTFPDYNRAVTALDEIPLFFYHKDMDSRTIDANGRNSICFAPTILDYLDISAANYFGGTSLFAKDAASVRETTYTDSNMMFSTDNNEIIELDKEQQKQFATLLKSYYITKETVLKDMYYYPEDDVRRTDRYFNSDGYYYLSGLPVHNSWVKKGTDPDPSAWYHTNESGHFVTDPTETHTIPITIDGITYTAVKIAFDGVVYTFDNTNGKLLLGDVVNEGGKLYYYWAGQPMTGGWFRMNDRIYYAYEGGRLAEGSVQIDGKTYEFGKQGELLDVWKYKTIPIYRLYHVDIDEHLYTASIEEKNELITSGWLDEGIGWYAPEKTEEPVYRLYHANQNTHFYTKNQTELDQLLANGWIMEGISFYSAPSEGKPIHRLYGPSRKGGTHHFTENDEERDSLLEAGWIYEGIGWYGVP